MQHMIDRLFTWGAGLWPFRKWCQSEDHWSARMVDFFWIDCACCLFFRGIVVGLVPGIAIGLSLAAILYAIGYHTGE